jgi:hypothetical protein
MPGLAASRWATGSRTTTVFRSQANRAYAPVTTTEKTSTTTVIAQQQPQAPPRNDSNSPTASSRQLQRFLRIVRRLKWKIPDLARGYHEAVDRVGPNVDRAHVDEAALMFKLDFFEYYMLIERALVHLLGVFGVGVSRGFKSHHIKALMEERDRTTQSAPETGTSTPNRTFTPLHDHRYHANVLEALDNPGNPLHNILGTGDVRRQFARAKELRNRWKNIDETEEGNRVASTHSAAPLESYNLEQIISTIFDGFDRAYILAEQYVMEEQRRVNGGGVLDAASEMMDRSYTEEEQWEFYVDAMDWEAV